MSKKSFFKNNYAIIPFLLSGLLCIFIFFILSQKLVNSPSFSEILQNQSSLFVGLSGFIAFTILLYLVFLFYSLQKSKSFGTNNLSQLVQKMNNVRKIIEILVDSKLWLPGVKEFIDDEFEGLTFFEVKEFYKGKSKLAIEYLQEKKVYAETELLYLELKSLLITEPKQKKIPREILYPNQYNTGILKKWLEHKSGSGLWYYFGYKFGHFKEALQYEAVFERHQDKIIALANDINSTLFEDSSFNEVFLSKFGEYINKDLVPKLFQAQNAASNKLPKSIWILYFLFASFIGIGVILPLIFSLFQLPIIVLLCSFSFVISGLFFIVLSVIPLLTRSLNN